MNNESTGPHHRPLQRATQRTSGLAVLVVLAMLAAGCISHPPKAPEQREYVRFPPPPEPPRVQFLCNLAGELEDFAPPGNRFLDFLVGAHRRAPQSLAKPYGLDMHDGQLYVTDTILQRVALIDFKSRKFSWFGARGEGLLRKPASVRVGPDGRVYVADTVRRQIVAFDKEGRYRAAYGDGKTMKPVDVLVMSNELFALDIDGHCIKVFDLASAQLKRTIGKQGIAPGEFNHPNALAADQAGNIYVCDAINLRIQKIDRDGKPLLVFGKAGQGAGELARPRGLAVARDGTIYVADAIMGVVQLFNPEGKALMHLGGQGFGEGELVLPAQVMLNDDSVDYFKKYLAPDFVPEYLIFVANQLGSNKVSVFAFGHRAEAKPVPPQ
jgi:DNA-binding beta-propeller fold protein YncE